MTSYKPVKEWGSKARKAEANAYRGNNNRAVIEEQYETVTAEEMAALLANKHGLGIVTFVSAGTADHDDADEVRSIVENEAGELEVAPVDSGLADTRCGYCGERLGTTDPDLLADEFVYDFDGTLDYISLFHKACKDAADAEKNAGLGGDYALLIEAYEDRGA